MGQAIFVFQQCCLGNRVVAEFAFVWTTCILCNNFSSAAGTDVMADPVFGDCDWLGFGDFLYDLGFDLEGTAKLCTAIRTAISGDFDLFIWIGSLSCQAL